MNPISLALTNYNEHTLMSFVTIKNQKHSNEISIYSTIEMKDRFLTTKRQLYINEITSDSSTLPFIFCGLCPD